MFRAVRESVRSRDVGRAEREHRAAVRRRLATYCQVACGICGTRDHVRYTRQTGPVCWDCFAGLLGVSL